MNSAEKPAAAKQSCNPLRASSVYNPAIAVAATSRLFLELVFVSVLLVSIAGTAHAQTEKVLYSFTGGADGGEPWGNLIQNAGTLYGTNSGGGPYGSGTVFMLKASGAEKTLYSFTGGTDGGNPHAGLIQDTQGNLYGTTQLNGAYGGGTVFVVSPSGAERVLYSFRGADGSAPNAGLIQDAQGNLYGTTYFGGAYGAGTVFMLSRSGRETVLYSFTGGADGLNPMASLIGDAQGNLYGTTLSGGAYGAGTVFRVSPKGSEKVLYSFSGGLDGERPAASLIQDAQGNLYGTTLWGGQYNLGTVFVVTPSGAEQVLHSFTGGWDGGNPFASLVQDAQGYLYGTTKYGGAYGCGTVFIVDLSGGEKVLYSFKGGTDGAYPYGGLVQDAQGNFYGTTLDGGAYGWGTVFMLQP